MSALETWVGGMESWKLESGWGRGSDCLASKAGWLESPTISSGTYLPDQWFLVAGVGSAQTIFRATWVLQPMSIDYLGGISWQNDRDSNATTEKARP